jgi:hypothetical protein
MVGENDLQANAKLMQVVHTLNALRLRLGPGHRRQQEPPEKLSQTAG